MKNQSGGVISKLLFIPIAAACLAGVFFLGYFLGKQQGKAGRNEIVVPLPEVVSENVPTTSEYTFFKTLSDKENKTVSIELKPKPAPQPQSSPEKARPQHAEAAPAPAETAKQQAVKKEQPAARPQAGKTRYTLQTASYQDKSIAEHDVKSLKQHGYAAFIVASNLPGKGTWYRVRLGSFANRGSAEKLQKDLRSKEGMSSVVLVE